LTVGSTGVQVGVQIDFLFLFFWVPLKEEHAYVYMLVG
jgi:hypothetical protein